MLLNSNPFIDKNHNKTLHAGSYVRRRQCPAVKVVSAVVVTKAVIMALTRLERAQAWILSACMGVLFALFRLLAPRLSGGFTKLQPVTNPLLMMSAMQLAQRIRRREVCSSVARGSSGMPNTAGVVSRRGVLSVGDAPPVALLKRAGAIPLGVTNSSELCMWCESHNHLYGICNNPYDLERTPGGSSGGEGSILGSGASVIGIGSDIGGSIRMPCFFNGIFGHKTTPGVISNDCQYPPASGRHEDYLSTGPMCRYAEDLLPMLRIMAGPNAHKLSLSIEVNLWNLRFFSIPHDGGSPLVSAVDEQLLQVQRRVVERLEADLGVKVQEMTSSSKPSPFIVKQKEKLQKEIEELLGTDGVLLYPTHPRLAPKHHHPLFTPFNFAYTGVINILGLPVTQCPLGLSVEGLPLGVQVVTGKLQDRLGVFVMGKF
ncbi:unnamed protein product [Coregonus sp. 'balchen']|nr:unnamed protein product [Coregonus sp. 'balchen']